MTIVDLNNTKVLEFKINDSNLIKSSELVILLPNQKEFRFIGEIKKNFNEIHVTIPILQNKIQEKTVAKYYLEVEDLSGKFHKVMQDEMLFQYSPIISLKFHETSVAPQVKLNEKNEVTLDTKIQANKKVNYKTSTKPPRRTEILVT